jgi:hypothetical protein
MARTAAKTSTGGKAASKRAPSKTAQKAAEKKAANAKKVATKAAKDKQLAQLRVLATLRGRGELLYIV